MLAGLLLNGVLLTSQGIAPCGYWSGLGTPIGFARVRVTKEKSFKVSDIPSNATRHYLASSWRVVVERNSAGRKSRGNDVTGFTAIELLGIDAQATLNVFPFLF